MGTELAHYPGSNAPPRKSLMSLMEKAVFFMMDNLRDFFMSQEEVEQFVDKSMTRAKERKSFELGEITVVCRPTDKLDSVELPDGKPIKFDLATMKTTFEPLNVYDGQHRLVFLLMLLAAVEQSAWQLRHNSTDLTTDESEELSHLQRSIRGVLAASKSVPRIFGKVSYLQFFRDLCLAPTKRTGGDNRPSELSPCPNESLWRAYNYIDNYAKKNFTDVASIQTAASLMTLAEFRLLCHGFNVKEALAQQLEKVHESRFQPIEFMKGELKTAEELSSRAGSTRSHQVRINISEKLERLCNTHEKMPPYVGIACAAMASFLRVEKENVTAKVTALNFPIGNSDVDLFGKLVLSKPDEDSFCWKLFERGLPDPSCTYARHGFVIQCVDRLAHMLYFLDNPDASTIGGDYSNHTKETQKALAPSLYFIRSVAKSSSPKVKAALKLMTMFVILIPVLHPEPKIVDDLIDSVKRIECLAVAFLVCEYKAEDVQKRADTILSEIRTYSKSACTCKQPDCSCCLWSEELSAEDRQDTRQQLRTKDFRKQSKRNLARALLIRLYQHVALHNDAAFEPTDIFHKVRLKEKALQQEDEGIQPPEKKQKTEGKSEEPALTLNCFFLPALPRSGREENDIFGLADELWGLEEDEPDTSVPTIPEEDEPDTSVPTFPV